MVISTHSDQPATCKPGTYALILKSTTRQKIHIGRLGALSLKKGIYVYIGSGFGPGGVRARLKHHRRVSPSPHWHIDYLRQVLPIVSIWYSHDPERHEHHWATTFMLLSGTDIPLLGFGASDCRCRTHLLYFVEAPSPTEFRQHSRKLR
ncbi:MAG: hypothetical protein CMH81_00145 [Nitrospiraceae bacterium]|jgi:Uri superfamily endonuclease|nr:hypothetical protein [Nitrospiraceae bacterium]